MSLPQAPRLNSRYLAAIALTGALTGALGVATSGLAHAETITFSEINPNTTAALAHNDVWGKVGDSLSDTIKGVTFSVVNFHATTGELNEGRIFDTNETQTPDPDLEDPWSGGNLPVGTDLDRILIIQEHDSSQTPDDEGDQGSTGAGSITLDFTTAITSFGLDLVDIENGGSTESKFGYLQFFDGANSTSKIFFDSFETQGGSAGNAIFGNDFINRINPLSAASFGFSSFDKVVVKLQGSGGIDNIQFSTVPVPGALILLGSSLLSLGWLARRRRTTA